MIQINFIRTIFFVPLYFLKKCQCSTDFEILLISLLFLFLFFILWSFCLMTSLHSYGNGGTQQTSTSWCHLPDVFLYWIHVNSSIRILHTRLAQLTTCSHTPRSTLSLLLVVSQFYTNFLTFISLAVHIRARFWVLDNFLLVSNHTEVEIKKLTLSYEYSFKISIFSDYNPHHT